MSALIHERAGLKDQPGLHAIFIGVSDYPNLPATEPDVDAGAPDFGLRSLTAMANSAERLAQWFVDHQGEFTVPLATCRLLVSPSAGELARNPAPGGGGDPADLQHVKRAAAEWRADASSHADNVSLFYFAGHGLQRRHLESVTDQVLLLSGFGDPGDTVFAHGFSIHDLIDAMAPGKQFPRIARTQYYFFDACRNAPRALDDSYDRVATATLLDVQKRSPDDNRECAIFQTAQPDSRAYAHPDGMTYFAVAFLRCLDGGAGEEDTVVVLPPQWNVTLDALDRGVEYYLECEATRHHVKQRVQPTSNMRRDTILCRLDGPPRLPLTVLVSPINASQFTQVTMLDAKGGVAWTLPLPVDPHPLTGAMVAGIYSYRAIVNPPGTPRAFDAVFNHYRPGTVIRICA